MDFFIFWGKGEKGNGFGGGECKLGIRGVCKLPASYQQVREGGVARWGIKVEFGGFIGGFGKIFFTRGIKREKRVLGGGRIYIFLKIFKEVEKSSKFYGEMYFWGLG